MDATPIDVRGQNLLEQVNQLESQLNDYLKPFADIPKPGYFFLTPELKRDATQFDHYRWINVALLCVSTISLLCFFNVPTFLASTTAFLLIYQRHWSVSGEIIETMKEKLGETKQQKTIPSGIGKLVGQITDEFETLVEEGLITESDAETAKSFSSNIDDSGSKIFFIKIRIEFHKLRIKILDHQGKLQNAKFVSLRRTTTKNAYSILLREEDFFHHHSTRFGLLDHAVISIQNIFTTAKKWVSSP